VTVFESLGSLKDKNTVIIEVDGKKSSIYADNLNSDWSSCQRD
jgi:hypothetical protein